MNSSQSKLWVTVDDANLTATALFKFGSHIDWKKLLKPLQRCADVSIEVISSTQWMTTKRRAFIEKNWRADVWSEVRNADCTIAGSLLRGARDSDHLILVAGDSGYAEVVDFLRSKDKTVEVWFFDKCLGLRLLQACNVFRNLDSQVLLPKSAPALRAAA